MLPGRLMEPEPRANPAAGAASNDPTTPVDPLEAFVPTSNIEPVVVPLARAGLTSNELTPANVISLGSITSLSVKVGIAQRFTTPPAPTETRLPANVARTRFEF